MKNVTCSLQLLHPAFLSTIYALGTFPIRRTLHTTACQSAEHGNIPPFEEGAWCEVESQVN